MITVAEAEVAMAMLAHAMAGGSPGGHVRLAGTCDWCGQARTSAKTCVGCGAPREAT